MTRMSRALPHPPSANTKSNKPVDALSYEIAQEMASALGRLGRRLEKSLQALETFDAAYKREGMISEDSRDQRHKLMADAAQALWQFIVQREACGLRDSRQIMQNYHVPPEVRNRMGAFP
jgi:chemotaxis regulatin CheY-phosphate phosphatase CheZ